MTTTLRKAMDDSENLLTKADIARKLRISLRTVENWVKDGTLPPPDLGINNRRYWYLAKFEAFIREKYSLQHEQPRPPAPVQVAENRLDTEKTPASRAHGRKMRLPSAQRKPTPRPAIARMAFRNATDLDLLNA
ncbi:helix-turn-helix domain-containing protein [Paraburkholderia sp. FT54]|uniref:helix-turn-helix transcriptional regulator n=1 Tax=Paraburkholderia sp. FT54 TaxID=3074437 RepID=UPI0028779EC2|nr:helix-turn-helix domain-containing protein [Paraburkholderia sp. FT54]WNC90203.1 helix-turn-helix domain-containing protein [Paraburkholderia sp. FT54]